MCQPLNASPFFFFFIINVNLQHVSLPLTSVNFRRTNMKNGDPWHCYAGSVTDNKRFQISSFYLSLIMIHKLCATNLPWTWDMNQHPTPTLSTTSLSLKPKFTLDSNGKLRFIVFATSLFCSATGFWSLPRVEKKI